MIDVPASQLRLLEEMIRAEMPDVEVWAFGSRINGTAKPWSDLDLVLVRDEKLPFDRYLQLRNLFEESDLSFRVDLMDFHRLNPSFQEVVLQRHEVLYKPATLNQD